MDAAQAPEMHSVECPLSAVVSRGQCNTQLRASNENANSMLDLYLFKGRNSPVTFSRTNQDSMAVVPNRRKTLGFKALAIAKGSVASTVEPATQSGRSRLDFPASFPRGGKEPSPTQTVQRQRRVICGVVSDWCKLHIETLRRLP